MAACNGVHNIDGGYARLNHLLGVRPLARVDGRSLNVQESLGKDRWAPVNGLSGAVENAPKHILGHGGHEDFASEVESGLLVVNAGGALKDLHNCAVTLHLKHLSTAGATISEGEVDDLCVLRRLHNNGALAVTCAMTDAERVQPSAKSYTHPSVVDAI